MSIPVLITVEPDLNIIHCHSVWVQVLLLFSLNWLAIFVDLIGCVGKS